MTFNYSREYDIEAENLSKAFGKKTALRNVDIRLRRGDSLVLFGPNGAGKTTLIHILCTLLQPTSGKVRIAGCDARYQREALHRAIGLISHRTFLYLHLSAWENLQFYGTMYGVRRLNSRIGEVLDLVGLTDFKHETIQTYSRGMSQRLAFARAIIHDPKVLFLDEPFAGLDQLGIEVVKNWILQFRGRGKTILMASHNLELGLDLCAQAAILKSGMMICRRDVASTSKDDFKQLYRRRVDAPAVPAGAIQ